MPDIPDPAALGWHLDRRIPIALIVAIIVQSGSAVWFASSINQRVSALESRAAIDQTRDDPSRITRVETKLEAVQRTLDKLDTKLDRIIQGPGK